MLDNNTVYFLNIIWTYCTCMYYVSEINEYYYYPAVTMFFLTCCILTSICISNWLRHWLRPRVLRRVFSQ